MNNLIHKERRAILVGPSLTKPNGGPFKSVLQFKHAIEGAILSLGGGEPEHGILGVPLLKGPLGALYSVPTRAGLEQMQRETANASIIQVHMLFRYHVRWAQRRSKQLNVPYFIVPHGGLDPYVFTYRRIQKLLWMKFVGRNALESAAGVIYSTKRERDKAIVWAPNQRDHIVYWPCDLGGNFQRDEMRRNLRRRLGISEKSRVLLTLGRVHPMKRPVDSVKLFCDATKEAHLVFVGGGDERSMEQLRLCAENCHPKRVHVLGPIFGAEKEEIIAGADGYWSYSLRENFNHSAVECLSNGLPLVLSSGNDLGYELRDAKCGWMDLATVPETAAALRSWENRSLDEILALGAAGSDWVRRELTMDRFNHQVRRIFGCFV
jgi:glycosyltransferase involved in cell wall biosynthesis